MSNQVIERKHQLSSYINSKEVSKRLEDLFGGDEKKASKFKATLFNIALDKSLVSCELSSVLKSALMIAEAELPISKQLGLAYIVPFGREAQPIISYKGYKHLLRRDGILIKAREVYKTDDFKMEFDGFDDIFRLEVGKREDNEKWIRENLTGIWVAVKYTDINEVENFFVSREKLDQLANLSKAKNSKFSPYNTGFWLEMYVAKAVGYISRKIGVSGDNVAKAFEIENSQSTLLEEPQRNDGIDILDMEIEDISEDNKETE